MFQILVVEDDKNTLRLMENVLAANGYQPILAKDGVEALDMLDHKQIDLIVLDIMMPHMDGFELTQQLRQTKSNLPILMVTARESAKDKKKGFLLGADDYMVKPVDEEEMILRIAALL
ncbi:MAG TPA: response regulator, partial [Bacillota bacterium]|nr:response regulator [Bacillota bacterium]